jgi:hypothetical protein
MFPESCVTYSCIAVSVEHQRVAMALPPVICLVTLHAVVVAQQAVAIAYRSGLVQLIGFEDSRRMSDAVRPQCSNLNMLWVSTLDVEHPRCLCYHGLRSSFLFSLCASQVAEQCGGRSACFGSPFAVFLHSGSVI